MITLKSCPNCDSIQIMKYPQVGTSPQVIHEILPGVKVDAAIITRYFVCQNCNLIFQNPRMSNTELYRYYSEGYYRRMLNMTVKEINATEAYRAKVNAEIIKKNIGNVKAHLDVGCGRGYLLRSIGAKIKVGVELEVSYPEVKGVRVYSRLSEVPKKQFDLVTAIHVLEHEPDPQAYLKKMASFVSETGYLIIEVPTWKSQGSPLRLAHLYHFEPDVLKLMCREVGLDVKKVEFTPDLLIICKPGS